MRISDWSSDVCSADLLTTLIVRGLVERVQPRATGGRPQARYVLTAEGRELFPRNYGAIAAALISQLHARMGEAEVGAMLQELGATVAATQAPLQGENGEALTRALAQRLDALGYERSEEHTSELQSLMRISYAVCCLKKKKKVPRYQRSSARHKR